MIRSEHPWRHESVQLRTYLEGHSNRVPLDGTFVYSREELFRRRLLRRLPEKTARDWRTDAKDDNGRVARSSARGHAPELRAGRRVRHGRSGEGKDDHVCAPEVDESGGLESHLISLLHSLKSESQHPVIICLDYDAVSEYMEPELRSRTVVKCFPEPQSFLHWFRLIRVARADIVVFCYRSLAAFPWQAPLASLLAGVRRRIAIQYLVPLSPPPPVEGKLPMQRLRRLIGHRARYLLKTKIMASASSTRQFACRTLSETL